MLTKSLFKLGQDCPKALWMTLHMPDEKVATQVAAQARMISGKVIGELARKRYPDGTLIEHWDLSADEAVAATLSAIERAYPIIFEATFISGDLLARADILVRKGDSWHLQEVKASSRYKKEDHLSDVAFQVLVARRSGIPISSASVLHLNKGYVWEGDAFDASLLFAESDITSDVDTVIGQVSTAADSFLTLWSKNEYPSLEGADPHVDPGIRPTCRECDFKNHCFDRAPKNHIFYVGMHHSRVKKLKGEGITLVSEVPVDFIADPKERLRFEALLTQELQIGPDLGSRLREIQFPAHLIDFETLRPDLPIVPKTAPFELLPFQWSCHTLQSAPKSDEFDFVQRGFLHEEQSDPRPEFCRSLYELLATGGSILVYSNYEETVLKDLASKKVPYADELLALVPSRFIDLEKIVKECYADHRFGGQTSMKAVLPVVSTLNYGGLEIQNGDQAQLEYLQTFSSECSEERRIHIYESLKAYCALDTLGMVMVLKALFEYE